MVRKDNGNIPEGEIPYLKIFLKSLQLTKLEIFLVLIFKFIWNLPRGGGWGGVGKSVISNVKAFLR